MDFNALLALMVQKNSFDLFITAGRAPTMKIDGELVEVSKTPLIKEQTLALVLSIMDVHHKEEFHRTKECQFAIGVPKIGHFRVSAFIQRDAAAMVLHRIRYEIPDINSLNLPTILKKLVMEKRGLILFVGSNSERLTSFHSLIQYRNQNSNGHIIVIDDPMEFMHAHAGCIVTQREVGIDTDSFETALKHALQQSPNVVGICEMKSAEIVQEVIKIVDANRLCLSTIQARDAEQAIEKILGFFADEAHIRIRIELSRCLLGIVSQQTLNGNDGNNNVITEVLLATPQVTEALRRGELQRFKELIINGRETGMQSFDQSLFELLMQHKICYEEAFEVAEDKKELRSMAKGMINYSGIKDSQNVSEKTVENQEKQISKLIEPTEIVLSEMNDPHSDDGSIFTHR